MSTYLFYDLETTGLNCAFDQVLQFAAIRTDHAFHEIARHEIMVKLRPDVIPSPGAMIAHGISITKSMSGILEYEAMKQIHGLLNTPDTISVGYNTLGFDDEFLRFSFHRNLLPPYTHQYANNCGRMDLLPIITIYWLYKKDVLVWPEVDEKVSLKLEHLNEANSLIDGMAHDAEMDVEVCVELARKLAREQEMWNYLTDYFYKNQDMNRLKKLPGISDSLPAVYKLGLLISTTLGSKQNYQVPVLFLGHSIPYDNQSLWLRLDLPNLRTTTIASIPEQTWVIRKKYGEPGIILPPYERFLAKIDFERCQNMTENKKWLEENPELLEKISRYYREYAYPEIPNVDADAMLYKMDFLSNKDQELCLCFHKAPLSKKVQMCDHFTSPVLRELSRRVIFRNYADQLLPVLKRDFNNYMDRVNPSSSDLTILDYKGKKRTTPASALHEIKKLKADPKTVDTQQIDLLNDLENYIKDTFIIPEINMDNLLTNARSQ